MFSGISFNLDQSKILSSCNGLTLDFGTVTMCTEARCKPGIGYRLTVLELNLRCPLVPKGSALKV